MSTSFRAQVETTLGVPGLGISSLAEVLWDEGLGTYQETQGYVATQEATEQINFALLEPYSEPANLYVRQFGGPWYHIPKDAPGGPQSAIRNAELALGVVRYGIMVSLLRDVEALDLIEQPYAPGLEAYRGTFDLYDYAESVGTLGTIDADESTLLEGSPPGSVVIWVDHRTGLPYTYEIQLKAESEGFVVFELQQEVFFASHNRYVPIPESPAEAPPLPAGELPA